tara:strand:- start:1292 stop:1609 length:318 start_codon:yes stop_codon:yes gene_type:complete
MVYHYTIHFRNYSLVEGLIREKLYVEYGDKLNNIYYTNVKKIYFEKFKKNYFCNIHKKTTIKIIYKTNILDKAYKFINKSSKTNKYIKRTTMGCIISNYLKKKYI